MTKLELGLFKDGYRASLNEQDKGKPPSRFAFHNVLVLMSGL
jgi:hypothetical protein